MVKHEKVHLVGNLGRISGKIRHICPIRIDFFIRLPGDSSAHTANPHILLHNRSAVADGDAIFYRQFPYSLPLMGG
jgi:hypothetical protein